MSPAQDNRPNIASGPRIAGRPHSPEPNSVGHCYPLFSRRFHASVTFAAAAPSSLDRRRSVTTIQALPGGGHREGRLGQDDVTRMSNIPRSSAMARENRG
jgi:hypothetical protein